MRHFLLHRLICPRLLPCAALTLMILASAPAALAQSQQVPYSSAPANSPSSVQKNLSPSVIRGEPPTKAGQALTGNFLSTFNISTLGRPAPSLNSKLTLDYALPHGQILDLRVENYYEGSYNNLPPGDLSRNINEHKLEVQVTYTRPLSKIFFLSPALLHHDNFRFHDTYYWGILTLTAKLPLSKTVTFTPNISAEKRFSGGRLFYDTATTLDDVFLPNWTAEATYHRYENYGELDPEPTEKEEQEYGLIRQLPGNKTLALSFFRHIQHSSPNDQFSFIHLKFGFGF